MGPAAYIAILRQEKSSFLRLPRSTSASEYKHYKCYVTILLCQIWGRDTGNAGEWKALTQGTQGKKTKAYRSILAAVRRIQSAESPPSLWLRISVLLRLHREMAVDYLQINKHMRGITLLHFKNWSSSVTH